MCSTEINMWELNLSQCQWTIEQFSLIYTHSSQFIPVPSAGILRIPSRSKYGTGFVKLYSVAINSFFDIRDLLYSHSSGLVTPAVLLFIESWHRMRCLSLEGSNLSWMFESHYVSSATQQVKIMIESHDRWDNRLLTCFYHQAFNSCIKID